MMNANINRRPGLPTLCLKKVWKLREVLNIRFTTCNKSAQVKVRQRETGAFPILGWAYIKKVVEKSAL